MRKPILKRLASSAGRIARDNSGNTLAIVAAAIIPLTAVIGGGFDVARTRLAQYRISQACDAAALAGRRAMSNEDVETAKPEALKFFNFNFPQGYLDTTAFTPQITKPDTGTIRVQATTSVPTTIMKIFGYGTIPISVECDATQNFDNLDIVLVLDVTGSMDQMLSGEKKIVTLRKAVMALYDELATAQTQLASQGLRLRYAIVPYSMTVNVGKLVRAANSNYIANNWTYQSRQETVTCDKKGKNCNTTYTFGPKAVDVSAFAAGSSVNTKGLIGGSNNSVSWNGCIEERQTVSTITPTSSTAYDDIPSGALDLNIDKIPDANANTKWGPHFPDIVFTPNGSSHLTQYCPKEASKLKTMTKSEMQTYVDALTPVGGTYHDIGMIWGARFISRNGIFGGENPTVYNDRPVNRYVIFMTDGNLEPNSDQYVAYGVEYLDRRVMGGTYGQSVTDGNGSNLEKRHSVRFQMACNAAKKGGASIWAIAFSTDVTSLGPLQNCASNADQFALSKKSTDLIAKFKEIGKNIGALRLSQ